MTRGMPLSLVTLVGTLLTVLAAGSARASQPGVFSVEGYKDLTAGELDGVQVDGDGVLRLGPEVEPLAPELSGPVLALTRASDGAVYAATAAPGRIWRLGGESPQLVAEVEEPLITALVAFGKNTLAAVTAPKAGVRLLSLTGEEVGFAKAPEGVELLLDAAALKGKLYVVGGGEEGVLLSMTRGAEELKPVASVETKHLRSVDARSTKRGDLVVVGTAEDGRVYKLAGERLQALADADPDEVVDLTIDRQGRVYAALVDASGDLTDDAASIAKTDREEGKEKKKKRGQKEKKPRKVKGGEVLRLDPDGMLEVLWQSKDHGPYAIALRQGQVLLGTGPHGRLYALDPEGQKRATVLGRAKDADEVVAFAPSTGGLALATAHPGGAQVLTDEPARRGTFTSAALDAETTARLGRLAALGDRGQVLLSARTGYTEEPDDTWAPFSPTLKEPGVPAVVAGRYAQIRLELVAGREQPTVRGARLSYLPANRQPDVVSVEVVSPGWKVVANEKSDNDSRSVSFSRSAFKKYLDARGSALPSGKDRGAGKQTFEPGFRTVYAYVEDEDDDLLRYRFELRSAGASPGAWREVKAYSDEPFVSLDASRLQDGAYQVRVHVDDLLSNGPRRREEAQALSPVFEVRHSAPRFSRTRAVQTKGGVRLGFTVDAELPLAMVRCSVGGAEWVPVDPADGILDSPKERFDVVVPGEPRFGSASCQAVDEGRNEARVDLPVRE